MFYNSKEAKHWYNKFNISDKNGTAALHFMTVCQKF